MDKTNLLFSVIIPIYNREDCMRDAINSVLEQDCDDWELILVDDGATDNSGKICDEYANGDKIRVVHKKNGGLSSARNAGIEVAKGDYVMFLDSDDLYCKNTVSTVRDRFIKYGCPDFCAFGYYINDEPQKHIPQKVAFDKLYDRDFLYNKFLPINLGVIPDKGIEIYPFACTKAYKRDILIEHNLRYDEFLRAWEDKFFTILFLKYANSLLCIDDALYVIRCMSEDQLSKTNFIETIRTLSHKYDIMKGVYGKEFDMENRCICNQYKNIINLQTYYIVNSKEDEKFDRVFEIFDDDNYRLWYKNSKSQNRYEEKIRQAVLSVNKEDLHKAFYEYSDYDKKTANLRKWKRRFKKLITLSFLKK